MLSGCARHRLSAHSCCGRAMLLVLLRQVQVAEEGVVVVVEAGEAPAMVVQEAGQRSMTEAVLGVTGVVRGVAEVIAVVAHVWGVGPRGRVGE